MRPIAEELLKQFQRLQQQQQQQKLRHMEAVIEKAQETFKKTYSMAQASQASQTSTQQTAQIIQFPLWPDLARGVPNSVLRSALFGVIRKGRRRYIEAERIAALDGIDIRYTGQRLDQGDLDVWEQCLHLARTTPLGNRVEFSASQFLRAIGRNTGKSQREWLKDALRRLLGAIVEVQDGRRAYAGQLLHHWYRDEETGRHVIEINPKLAQLYGSDGWTAIKLEDRLKLSGQLAKWLHAFYSSHAEPYPIKVETLRRLSGSEAEELYKFRQSLRQALAELQAATGWEWEIDENDLVHIKKTKLPATQDRHLFRRALKTSKRKGGSSDG